MIYIFEHPDPKVGYYWVYDEKLDYGSSAGGTIIEAISSFIEHYGRMDDDMTVVMVVENNQLYIPETPDHPWEGAKAISTFESYLDLEETHPEYFI